MKTGKNEKGMKKHDRIKMKLNERKGGKDEKYIKLIRNFFF